MSAPRSAKWRSWLRSPLPESSVEGRLVVVYHRRESLWGTTKVQGLFSEFFAVLGALNYAISRKAAGVKVMFSSALYRDLQSGPNWWAYFFTDTMYFADSPEDSPPLHFRGWQRLGPYAWNESWTSQIIPNNSRQMPYPLDSEAELRTAARLTARFIRVLPAVRQAVDGFWAAQVREEDLVIGLHYRGTDKSSDFPNDVPVFALYASEVYRILELYQPSTFRIFVATDQVEFLTWAKGEFGGCVFAQDDVPRLSSADVIGATHGSHKHPAFTGRQKGLPAVMDCLLLARCGYMIKNRSSLSDAALAFNPKMDWTVVLGTDRVVRGVGFALEEES